MWVVNSSILNGFVSIWEHKYSQTLFKTARCRSNIIHQAVLALEVSSSALLNSPDVEALGRS